MKKKVFLVLAIAGMMASVASAQSNFTLKLGGAFPNGDFADGDANRWGLVGRYPDGGAGTGINIGGEWGFKVSGMEHLTGVFSIDVFYNGLNEDLRDDVDDERDRLDDNYDDYSMSTPKYFNVPIMVGLNYARAISQQYAIYGQAAVGVNARYITPFSVETENRVSYGNVSYRVTESMKTSFNMTFSFGYRIAAGITMNGKYSLEVGYYNLGAGKVKGVIEAESRNASGNGSRYSDTEKFSNKSITPALITLRLGIKM